MMMKDVIWKEHGSLQKIPVPLAFTKFVCDKLSILPLRYHIPGPTTLWPCWHLKNAVKNTESAWKTSDVSWLVHLN